MSIDFKWDTEDADLVCIHKVNAIAVYQNWRNEIVIRQENDYGNDDSLVLIPPEHVNALISKLKEVQEKIEMNSKTTP